MVRKSALGAHFAAMSGVESAEAKLKSLPMWQGPFRVISRPSPNVFEVELPGGLRVHNRINVENLRPANDVECDKPPPVSVSRNGVEYAVEKFTGHKKVEGRTYIRVKWVGDGWPQTYVPLTDVSHLYILLGNYFGKGRVPSV